MGNIEIANKLKEARLRAGLTQKQVYEQINVPQSTFSSWEIGKSEPDAATFLQLCSIYGIKSLKELGVDGINESLSAIEQNHIYKFRILDDHGKEVVTSLLDAEHERMERLEQERLDQEREAQKKYEDKPIPEDDEDEDDDLIEMRIYNQKASAGLGSYLNDDSDDDYETMEFPANTVPSRADFGVRISGDSMEPTIDDGSIVWVEATPAIEQGEIGIFIYDDEAYCKEISISRSRRVVTLISHNDDYEDKIIKDTDRLKTVGRVIVDRRGYPIPAMQEEKTLPTTPLSYAARRGDSSKLKELQDALDAAIEDEDDVF